MSWFVAVDWLHVVHTIHWSDPATWLASIGTVGVLLLGLLQYIRNSRLSEKRVHEEQAKNVTAWVVSNVGQEAWLAISNQSKNPIYEVILTLVPFEGAGDPTGKATLINFRAFLSVVPPGLYYARTDGNTGMHFHASASAAFTDSVGASWIRDGRGKLEEIKKLPTDYFGLPRPLSWTYPVAKIPKKQNWGPSSAVKLTKQPE